MLVYAGITWFIGTCEMGEQAGDGNVRGVVKQPEGVGPVGFVDAGAVETGVYFGGNPQIQPRVDGGAGVLRAGYAEFDSFDEGLFRPPHPREDGFVNAPVQQLLRLCQRCHPELVRTIARHDMRGFDGTMVVAVGFDHAHELRRAREFFEHASVVRNGVKVNGGGEQVHG